MGNGLLLPRQPPGAGGAAAAAQAGTDTAGDIRTGKRSLT